MRGLLPGTAPPSPRMACLGEVLKRVLRAETRLLRSRVAMGVENFMVNYLGIVRLEVVKMELGVEVEAGSACW